MRAIAHLTPGFRNSNENPQRSQVFAGGLVLESVALSLLGCRGASWLQDVVWAELMAGIIFEPPHPFNLRHKEFPRFIAAGLQPEKLMGHRFCDGFGVSITRPPTDASTHQITGDGCHWINPIMLVLIGQPRLPAHHQDVRDHS